MRRRTFLGMSSGLGIVATGLVPGPVSAGGRRPDVILAPGDIVQAAVDAAPVDATRPYVIGLRPGTYHGQVIVPRDRPLLEFRGLGHRPEDVIVADDRANGTPKPDGTTWGTSGSASVTVDGAGFRAVNLTFANLFDEAAHPEITNRQAVAVLTRLHCKTFTKLPSHPHTCICLSIKSLNPL